MNILIIDDHPIIAIGLKRVLRDNFEPKEMDVATSGHEAMELLQAHQYTICVLDLVLPNTDTHALLKQILMVQKKCKVLVYSSSPDEVYAMNYIREGASGFLNKNAPLDDFVTAVGMLLNGKMYISERILRSNFSKTAAALNPFENPFNKLSKRELELLTHVLQGKKNKEISQVLSIEQSTTATLKGRLMRKLGVNSVVELIALAKEYHMDV